jgi:hypothetical protein
MIAFDPVIPEGCDDSLWRGVLDVQALRRIGRAITTETGHSGAVALALADDTFVRNLNTRFRRIDRATNVLSFPSGETAPQRNDGPWADQDMVFQDVALGMWRWQQRRSLARRTKTTCLWKTILCICLCMALCICSAMTICRIRRLR